MATMRMTEERIDNDETMEATTMKTEGHSDDYVVTIEDIRSLEKWLFCFERFALQAIICFLFKPAAQRFLVVPAIMLILTSSFYLANCFDRRSIGLPFFEPDPIFYIERLGILRFLLYFHPGGSISSVIIGAAVLVFTSSLKLQQYLCGHLPYYIDMGKKKFVEIKDGFLKTIVKFNQEANMEAAEFSQDSFANGDEEEILQMSETSKDGKVMKKAGEDELDELKENVGNTIVREESEALKEFEKIEDQLTEEIAACNEGLQETRNNSPASKELKINREDEKEVIANACEVKDESVAASDLAGVNNDREDVLCNELERLIDGVQETKDKHEAKGNHESDGDNSWEEVPCISIERFESPDQKEMEVEDEEDCTSDSDSDSDSYCDNSEESSWEEGQNDASTEDLLYEYEELSLKWEQEKKDLTDKLETATKKLDYYLLMEKRFSEERLKWNKVIQCLKATLNASTEYWDNERAMWQDEKDELCSKLELAEVSIAHYKSERQKWDEEKNTLNATIRAAADEKDELFSKLEFVELSFEHYKSECQKWNEEKNALNATISVAADEKDELCSKLEFVEQSIEHYKNECQKWDEEKNALNATISAAAIEKDELCSKLEFVEQSIEHYKSEYQKWDEEKNALNATISAAADEKNELCSKLESAELSIEHYNSKCQEWDEEKNALNAAISAADEIDDLRQKLKSAELSIENHRSELQKWDEEKNVLNATIDAADKSGHELSSKLEFAELSIESERQKWDEEKNALNESLRHCQDLVNSYAEQCQTLEFQLYGNSQTSVDPTIEDLSSKLYAANSSASAYQIWYNQSEQDCQYYIGRLKESEEAYRKVILDNISLSAKNYNETTTSERYKKLAEELEDKCRKLDEDKADLTAKLCAAKASAELYRSCLHNSSY